MQIKEKFIPTNFGWISEKTPPVNHNNVVVLIWLKNDKIFDETIGYYQGNQWQLSNFNETDYEVKGWYPYPYTPHNH